MLKISFNHKAVLKRAAIVVAASVFIEAAVLPNAGAGFFEDLMDKGPEKKEMVYYIQSVLRHEGAGLAGLGKNHEARLAEFILVQSEARGLDPIFVLALIRTESGFYNPSRSEKGAMGLMQILPSTAKSVAEELQINWQGEGMLLNPYINIRLGIHYLAGLMKTYGDDERIGLAAYNRGPASVSSRLKQGLAVSGAFAERVFDNYRELKERSGFYLNG